MLGFIGQLWPVFSLCMSMGLAIEGRLYRCDIFSHCFTGISFWVSLCQPLWLTDINQPSYFMNWHFETLACFTTLGLLHKGVFMRLNLLVGEIDGSSVHNWCKSRSNSEEYGRTNGTPLCNHVWNSDMLSKTHFRSGKASKVFTVLGTVSSQKALSRASHQWVGARKT